jgi:hypothetical protein
MSINIQKSVEVLDYKRQELVLFGLLIQYLFGAFQAACISK